jgi:hypothetical protein
VEAGRTKGPASRLARELKPFGIVPKVLPGGAARGYEAVMFTDAWVRYLSPNGPTLLSPPEQRNDVTRNPNMASDQHITLLRPVGDGVEVTSSGRNGCPECGAASADPGYIGHANGCPRFYRQEEER